MPTTTTPEIELFYSPQPTRSARARWAFLESGVPFEGHAVDIFQGEHRRDAFLSVNPLGFVPAARFDGEPIIESAALSLIVALEAGGSLVPPQGTPEWRACLQWVVHGPAELDRLFATLNQHLLFLPPDQRDPAIVEATTATWAQRAQNLEQALGDDPYLLGADLTIADVVIGHDIVWARMLDLLGPHPKLAAYLARLTERPAFVQTYGPEIRTFPDPHAS